jgi:hypothetical protein
MGEEWRNHSLRFLDKCHSAVLCAMGLDYHILVVGLETCVRLISIDEGHMISEKNTERRTLSLCRGTDQEFFSGGDYTDVIQWRVQEGELELVRKFPLETEGGVFGLTLVTPTRLLAGDMKGNLVIWDLNSGDTVASWQGHNGTVYCTLPLTETTFVTGSNQGHLTIWEKEGEGSENYRKSRTILTNGSTAIAITPLTGHGREKWTALASWEGTITIYTQDWTVYRTSPSFDSLYTLCEVKPGIIATSISANYLVLWDYEREVQKDFKDVFRFNTTFVTATMPSGEVLLGDDGGMLGMWKFMGMDWGPLFQWLFLGRTDEGSALNRLPVEVLFNFVEVMENYGFD